MSPIAESPAPPRLAVYRGDTARAETPRQLVVRLLPPGPVRGSALLSYLTDPFVAEDGDWACHSNWWRCRQIAKTFLDLGLVVDVIDWTDQEFQPTCDYQFMVDIHRNLPRLAPRLGDGCVKMLHATGKHWLFSHRAEMDRLADLARRRGVALPPRRSVPTSSGVESCDVCTVLGFRHDGTGETFAYAGKPIYPLPPSSVAEFAWDETKDFGRARRRFLWFGSRGMVLKGLDLVLEAFAGMPDLELTVCGLIDQEPDFVQCYRRELYETANIRTLGWTDVRRREFAKLKREVAALVYPSATDACAGAAVTCMHAGLIPLVSRESGVTVGDAGQVLAESSVPAIRSAARQLSCQSGVELERRSRAVWEFARQNYTRQRYAEEFRRVATEWLPASRTSRTSQLRHAA